MDNNNKNNILRQPLNEVISDCFGRYAKYIIQDRALPDIRDGLKPVQRRILFAMNDLGLTFDKQYKKSARTVGEVIGKYHPHGDSSIYEAMVRMSQDWKNNLALLDMHGNNGSIDGDSAAAMRYTETKLSKVASLMLENIKKDTVDFSFNFDDTEKEPTVLPSLLPNLLINGGMGIAAGYATNIPPHNPSEVFDAIIHRILNPECPLREIMSIMPAPDFPTGGIIQGLEGVIESFETGRGKFIVSSKIEFNESSSKINQIIISEIPYDTNKSIIIKELSDMLYDETVPGLLEVRDESDKNGVSIVLDIKKDKDLNQIKNYILKNSHLQVSYATNFVAIVDRKPTLVPVTLALDAYIEFAISIIVKTSKYDLAKAMQRAEVVTGLIKAIDIIDKIIAIIRKSVSKEDAKNNLIAKFKFTMVQAEAIVSLRLYRLTKTDIEDLRFELKNLNQTIADLNALINSIDLQKKYLISLLLDYKKEYGYPRKTQIQKEITKLEIDKTAMIEQKEVYVLITKDGYIKQVTKKGFESNNFNELTLNPDDNVVYFQLINSIDNLLLISKLGKSIWLPVYKIKSLKWKELGQHINDLVTMESGDEILSVYHFNESVKETDELVLMTKYGISKRINLLESINDKQLKTTSLIKLKQDDQLVGTGILSQDDPMFISTMTEKGLGLTFSTAEIPLASRTAQGVKGIKLGLNDYVVNFALSKTLMLNSLVVFENGLRKIKLEDIEIKRRYQSPLICFKEKAKVIDFYIINDNDAINVRQDSKFSLLKLDELSQSITKTNLYKISELLSCKKNQYYSHEIVEDMRYKKEIYVPTEEQQTSLLENDEEK